MQDVLRVFGFLGTCASHGMLETFGTTRHASTSASTQPLGELDIVTG